MPSRRSSERPRPPDGWWPSASKPIAVEGGVKARSKRGPIGDTWWSQRFIAVLESFDIGSRLERGKRYARTGQVLNLDFVPGRVRGFSPGVTVEPLQSVRRNRGLDRFRVGRHRGRHGVEGRLLGEAPVRADA